MWNWVLTALASFVGGFWLAKGLLSTVDAVPAGSPLPNRKTLILWGCALEVVWLF